MPGDDPVAAALFVSAMVCFLAAECVVIRAIATAPDGDDRPDPRP